MYSELYHNCNGWFNKKRGGQNNVKIESSLNPNSREKGSDEANTDSISMGQYTL